MKLISKILLAILIGFVFAFGFSFLFLNLPNHSLIDQTLLLSFSTAAFGYIVFSFMEVSREAWKSHNIKKLTITNASFVSFFRDHTAGVLLAMLFFSIYLYIGMKINNPTVYITDNYLDADNSTWMHRIADPQGRNIEMRGPHPLAYLIFRPLGFLLNLFTHNFALSATLLNAFAGALCVFLAWLYFKRHTQNSTYALLMAGLLGTSTSHLFFGSVVETYIFSALSLIAFLVLLQNNETTIGGLVFSGLITFGITFTNFVQTFINFFISRRVKDLIRFVGLTLSFGIVLSLIQAALYSSTKLFFLVSSAQTEEQFTSSIFQEPSWRVIGRVILLARTILLYTVVAPRPYVFTTQVGGTFPRFNFFKIAPETFSYSSYSGLGTLLVFAWVILLLTAGVLFIVDLARTRKLDIRFGLLLCILFNFFLHMFYGYELFLYSADWAYALIFFVGLSLAPLAGNRIFMGAMAIFILGLALNQWQFFDFIFHTIAPFIK